jgi:peptide/nickel transport system substrate-binding protein
MRKRGKQVFITHRARQSGPSSAQRSRRLAVSLLLAGALVAGACGSDDSGDSAPATTADAGTETTNGATDGTAAPSETTDSDPADSQFDPNGELRYAINVIANSMDPHVVINGTMPPTLYPVYDRLIHLDPDGNQVPGLAESWEWNETVDVLTLNLRQGVSFHDGEPFNAEAVQANFIRQTTMEESLHGPLLASVDSVEVIDEYTVEYRLNRPNAALTGVLSSLAGMMVSPAAFDQDFATYPAGTGMYRLDEYRPNELMRYVRNEDYWDPEAQKLAVLEIYAISDDRTRLNGLLTDALEVASIRGARLIDEGVAAGLSVAEGPNLEVIQIYTNRSMEPFSDENFRLAVNHAIDREAIAQAIGGDWSYPVYQLFPEGYWAHSPGLDEYTYDPDLAREYLAQSQVEPRFTNVHIVDAAAPGITEAITAQLAEVGITMESIQTEAAGRRNLPFAPEQEAAAMLTEWAGRPDPSMTLELLMPGTFLNPGDDSTPELQDLWGQTVSIADPADRKGPISEMMQLAINEGRIFPIMGNVNQPVFSPDVIGADRNWIAGIEFRGVGIAAS